MNTVTYYADGPFGPDKQFELVLPGVRYVLNEEQLREIVYDAEHALAKQRKAKALKQEAER